MFKTTHSITTEFPLAQLRQALRLVGVNIPDTATEVGMAVQGKNVRVVWMEVDGAETPTIPEALAAANQSKDKPRIEKGTKA